MTNTILELTTDLTADPKGITIHIQWKDETRDDMHTVIDHDDFEYYLKESGSLEHTVDQYEPVTGHRQTTYTCSYWNFLNEYLNDEDLINFITEETTINI